jgi:hypothetical protein
MTTTLIVTIVLVLAERIHAIDPGWDGQFDRKS